MERKRIAVADVCIHEVDEIETVCLKASAVTSRSECFRCRFAKGVPSAASRQNGVQQVGRDLQESILGQIAAAPIARLGNLKVPP